MNAAVIYNNMCSRIWGCAWMFCLMALLPGVVASAPLSRPVTARGTSLVDEYSVSYLTMKQGLRHNFVDDMCADSRGFIWLAMSGGGLSRYDGYGFVHFSPNSAVNRVKSNFVMELCEDPFGRLWVASDAGIDVIDVATLAPAVPADMTGRLGELLDELAWCVELDGDGCLWIATASDIVRLQFDEVGRISGMATFNPPYRLDNKVVIRDVYGDGHVWVLLDGSIVSLGVDFHGNVIAEPVSEQLKFPSGIYVTDFVTKGGEVWISTDAGVCRYNRGEDIIKVYMHDDNDPNSLSQNFVTSLAITSDKRLLVGTLRGLNVYNPIRDNFMRIGAGGSDSGTDRLNNNFVNCILVDGERIWVGTEGGGVNKFTRNRLDVRSFVNDSGDPSSLSGNPVNAIFQDSDDMVWIGTVEGGLNRTDAGFNKFERFTVEKGNLSHNSVSALAEDGEGRLWVGTWGGGIDLISRRRPGRVLNHLSATPDGRHRFVYVGMLFCDSINNLMWIGCDRGLYVCDLGTMELSEPFPGASGDITGSVAGVSDLGNHLWVGGNRGLYEINLNRRKADGTFEYRYIDHKFDNPDDKSTEKVASMSLSTDGGLWIGTNGGGIYHRYIAEDGTEVFDNYTSADGLPNDIALGVFEDAMGAVWTATYNGLSYRRKNGTFINYDRADGLPGDQFYWNAACRLRDGNLVFGTTTGLAVLSCDAVRMTRIPSKVHFTRQIVDGVESTPGDGASLHESVKSIGLEFSALDYDSDSRGVYYYCLSGFDKDWIKLPAPHHGVSYTNLSPGSYVLEVKYLKPGFSFNDAPASSFPITVRPYFYRQWWFVSMIVLLLLVSAMLIHRWRVRDLTRQKINLMRSVNERTSEISTQKRLLERRAVELSEQNRRLKQSNEEIMSQKTRLAEMARRVQELSVDRISFFTNITHEFRTPITLIIGPIERALKLSYNPQVIEQLHFAERNSKYLLSLVNQLMDFRKVESGKMEIVRTRGNFRSFITDTVESFRQMAEDRRIDLSLVCRLRSDMFSYDEEALRKVIINLVGNAVKFTPDGGRVKVYAALVPSAGHGSDASLYISVCDSGNGIDEADIERVFERFYQGNSQLKYPVAGTSGSGIGLYLCKSIVEIYGGRIWAKNNAGGAGCSFRLLLPVEADSAGEPVPAVLEEVDAADGEVAEREGSDARTAILVVEDNGDMRAFIRSILSEHYSVVEASNGEEALRILMSRHIDFIISDLMMPVMDGLELSRRVKEDFAISHIPFLMLTAKTSDETRLESFRIGVDEYLQKPFDENLLLARIRNILDNKRRHNRSFVSDMNVGSLNIDEESRDKKFMDQVMTVVKDNYKNSYFEVGDFAEALGISRSLLNKKLQSLAGQSAGQLMRSYRMNLARELIIQNCKTRSMNISEIAYEVGFNDSKYFTRCFTKQFGISPSAFMAEG